MSILCSGTSCTCRSMPSFSLGKFSCMILLKIWSMTLMWDSSSSTPTIQKFDFFNGVPKFQIVPFLCLLKLSCSMLVWHNSSTLSSCPYIVPSTWSTLLSGFPLQFQRWLLCFIFNYYYTIFISAWVLFKMTILLLNSVFKSWICLCHFIQACVYFLRRYSGINSL